PPTSSTLFPYTTLFRSSAAAPVPRQTAGGIQFLLVPARPAPAGVAHRQAAPRAAAGRLPGPSFAPRVHPPPVACSRRRKIGSTADRKSTRLNSSHVKIS